MNCPNCKIRIGEHKAGRCLDAWVHKQVLDRDCRPDPGGVAGFVWFKKDWGYSGPIPLYSLDIAAAWEVHEMQIGKLFSKRREYLFALEEELREREKYTIAWPDALIFLSPLTISRAALKATCEKAEDFR